MSGRVSWLVGACLTLSGALGACSSFEPDDDSARTGSGGSAATGGTTSASGGTTPAGGAGNDSGGSSGGGTGGAPAVDPTCSTGVQSGTPKVLSLSGNTFAHDPTMIKVGGTYYRFWTGSRIPSATSTDLTHWVNAPNVYPGAYSAWTTSWLAG